MSPTDRIAEIQQHLDNGDYYQREDWGGTGIECTEPAIEYLLAEVTRLTAENASLRGAVDMAVGTGREFEAEVTRLRSALETKAIEMRGLAVVWRTSAPERANTLDELASDIQALAGAGER